jgi:hypothetical protein
VSNQKDDKTPALPEMTLVQREAFEATKPSVERVAMQIVAMPKEKWEAAFDVVRESQHEDAHRKRGFQPDHPDVKLWLDGYMAGVRILVAEIEASGGVAGGNA